MPLTPQDVHSKVFGPTRFRRGYDEAEVDAFREAEQQAEQLRRDAETEAERVRVEAAEQAERERLEAQRTRSQAEDDVEQLRAFEREYRTRLRAYLEHQLRELEDPNQQVE